MGNAGTFKPMCRRGHLREGNVDTRGHCNSCRMMRPTIAAEIKAGPTATGTFKPFCKRGHVRQGNTTQKGHCKTCAIEWRKIMNANRCAKRAGANPNYRPRVPGFCVNGHTRENNVDKTGHCLICQKDWQQRSSERFSEKWGSSYWKKIKAEDGSVFMPKDYNRQFQIQGGLCRGCKKHQSELKFPLAVDHDHKTGFFRGLLCRTCNTAIGMAQENGSILRALSDYLGEQE